jgi:hypothetical protein
MRRVEVSVLGMYALLENNSIVMDVPPYFSHFILSFNLVRKSWTASMSFLKIAIVDQR